MVCSIAVAYLAILVGPPLLRWAAPPVNRTEGNPHIRVWANTRSGFYYCPKSTLYGGIKPGKYAVETEALQSGYQPALKETCP